MTIFSDFMTLGQITTAEFSARLSKLYNRPPTCHWSGGESSMFCELSRRPDFALELDLVEAFKRTERLFPQSLERLLSSWTQVVDRARMKQTAPVTKSTPPPKLTGVELTDDQRRSMASQLSELRKRL